MQRKDCHRSKKSFTFHMVYIVYYSYFDFVCYSYQYLQTIQCNVSKYLSNFLCMQFVFLFFFPHDMVSHTYPPTIALCFTNLRANEHYIMSLWPVDGTCFLQTQFIWELKGEIKQICCLCQPNTFQEPDLAVDNENFTKTSVMFRFNECWVSE